jgi:hypothetical protein
LKHQQSVAARLAAAMSEHFNFFSDEPTSSQMDCSNKRSEKKRPSHLETDQTCRRIALPGGPHNHDPPGGLSPFFKKNQMKMLIFAISWLE